MKKVEFIIESKGIHLIRMIPESFLEFTRRDLLLFCYTITGEFKKKNMAGLCLLYRMLDIPAKIFFRLKNYQTDQIFATIGYTGKDPLCFDRWLLPRIWTRSLLALQLGPKGLLEDISLLQLSHAEACAEQYRTTKDPKQLHLMCSVLYQPLSPLRWTLYSLGILNDLKRPYYASKSEKAVSRFKNIPEHLLLAVHFNFIGIMEFFKTEFPSIPRTASEQQGHGWLGLIYELSGPQLGTVDELERSNAFKTLMILNKIGADSAKNKTT